MKEENGKKIEKNCCLIIHNFHTMAVRYFYLNSVPCFSYIYVSILCLAGRYVNVWSRVEVTQRICWYVMVNNCLNNILFVYLYNICEIQFSYRYQVGYCWRYWTVHFRQNRTYALLKRSRVNSWPHWSNLWFCC